MVKGFTALRVEPSGDPLSVSQHGRSQYALEHTHQEPGGFEPSRTNLPWGKELLLVI